ncbi:MAG: FAD-dependent oxidoreductase, partial [Pseudomonadota bacterium]
MKHIDTDICVIGAGSGGLSVAAGAVQMGAEVVLIEKDKMGGDCLNTGCVPSKALLSAGKKAQGMRDTSVFGIDPVEPTVDFEKTMEHVHEVIKGIEPHDSVERFEGLGVTVLLGAAKFTGSNTVQVNDTMVKAKRIVVATGSRAVVPPIPGLDDVPFLTNENLFDNRVLPKHLIIVGGGPIGMEMAQAHCQLGSKVTLIEMDRVLATSEPELASVVRDRLQAIGVVIHENARVEQVSGVEGEITAGLSTGDQIQGSHLLIATGRQPVTKELGLEAAGIEFDRSGIRTDARLRTTNKKVFAIGDVAGGPMFTHRAGYDAGIVIRNVLFKLPTKASYKAMPAVTYTEPELAQVGLRESEARAEHGTKAKVVTWEFQENDRARAERATKGLIKVVTDKKGKILGASIVGPGAGDLIQTWQLAVAKGFKMTDMAGIIAPYPTRSEISKRVAGAYFTDALFSPR